MGVIAELTAHVGANVREFKTGMSEVKKDTEEAGSGFGKMGMLAGGAGLLAVGAITGVAAFGMAAVAHAQEAGQAAFELSEKFGLLPVQASEWMSVGKQLGISGEQIAKGFQFLSKNVSAMQITLDAGGKISATVGEAYKELGIKVLDSGGKVKGAQQLMFESADAFAKMEEGPLKAALAMKLFGKSGTDLLPVLNQGSAGLRKLMENGKAMGDVMTNEQVVAAHKLYLQHKQLDTAIAGVTTQIGAFLMPVMANIMGYILGTAIPAVQRFAGYFNDHLMPAIKQVWSFFMTFMGPMLTYIKTHFDSLKPVLIAVGIVIGVVLGAAIIVIALVVLAVVGLVAGITWLVAKMREYGPAFLGHIQDMVIGSITAVARFATFLHDLPGTIWNDVVAIGTTIWRGIVAGLQGAGGAIMGALKALLPGGANGPVVAALHAAGVPGFMFGGTVPGAYLGQPQLVLAHAGEHYTPAGQVPGGGGGGRVVQAEAPYVIVQVDGRQLALAMAPHLVEQARLRSGLLQ